MDDLENKLGAILQDPQMMQKIMSLAQSLGQSEPAPNQEPSPAPAMPELDLQTLQKLSGLAGQSGIDKNQRNLLSALSPYLSRHRINKLEKAMRAAKMARLATTFLGR